MSLKIYIDKNKKQLVAGGKAFPLLYGFSCPFCDKPVIAIVKTKGKTDDYFSADAEEGNVKGVVFLWHIYYPESGDGVTDSLSLEYFYGLKEDKLIEKAHEKSGLKISLNVFKKRLLEGKLRDFKAVREVVNGEELLIAHKDKNNGGLNDYNGKRRHQESCGCN